MSRRWKKKEYDFALTAAVDAHTGWLLYESEKTTLKSRNHGKEFMDCHNFVCIKRREFLNKRKPDGTENE